MKHTPQFFSLLFQNHPFPAFSKNGNHFAGPPFPPTSTHLARRISAPRRSSAEYRTARRAQRLYTHFGGERERESEHGTNPFHRPLALEFLQRIVKKTRPLLILDLGPDSSTFCGLDSQSQQIFVFFGRAGGRWRGLQQQVY